jgi:hypothetical protein
MGPCRHAASLDRGRRVGGRPRGAGVADRVDSPRCRRCRVEPDELDDAARVRPPRRGLRPRLQRTAADRRRPAWRSRDGGAACCRDP